MSARGTRPRAARPAGTGARTPTASPPGARPAGPCRSGPAPARPPWRPSAGTGTTTDEHSRYKDAPVQPAEAEVLLRVFVDGGIDTQDAAQCQALEGLALAGIVHRVVSLPALVGRRNTARRNA